MDATSTVLGTDFYDRDCIKVAKEILGQTLVRVIDGTRVSGRIVEVECYLGGEDAASHSYRGKRTPRNEPMYMKPATAYVYSIYGMYYCFNVSTRGEGSCVLIRALEPMEGQDHMLSMRLKSVKSKAANVIKAKKMKTKDLCNGPSKLCSALSIDKLSCNKLDMSTSSILFIESDSAVSGDQIVECKRIGIDKCGSEWAEKPLRFYEFNNSGVSIRNKTAEQKLLDSGPSDCN